MTVKRGGLPNFLGSQIRVDSELKIENWEVMLEDYWDKQLLFLLKYGFPLDFNREYTLRSDPVNHSSATEHPVDVEAYLTEEIAKNAIMGPFKVPPISNTFLTFYDQRETGVRQPSRNCRPLLAQRGGGK